MSGGWEVSQAEAALEAAMVAVCMEAMDWAAVRAVAVMDVAAVATVALGVVPVETVG